MNDEEQTPETQWDMVGVALLPVCLVSGVMGCFAVRHEHLGVWVLIPSILGSAYALANLRQPKPYREPNPLHREADPR